jgi:nitroreductase/dihydropteridine reductase
MSSSFLSNLEVRRAVKKFIPGAVDTRPIRDAIVAAPTSFGLQPYKVIAVRDQALKAALRPVSFGQAQVTDCDTLFVFCALTDVKARAEQYIAATGAEGMRGLLMGFLSGQPDPVAWAARQAYIALGFAIAAAAEAGIASCPMEGFDPSKAAEILGLPITEKPLAYLAVGRTTPGDDGTYPRFRFDASDLIEDRA